MHDHERELLDLLAPLCTGRPRPTVELDHGCLKLWFDDEWYVVEGFLFESDGYEHQLLGTRQWIDADGRIADKLGITVDSATAEPSDVEAGAQTVDEVHTLIGDVLNEISGFIYKGALDQVEALGEAFEEHDHGETPDGRLEAIWLEHGDSESDEPEYDPAEPYVMIERNRKSSPAYWVTCHPSPEAAGDYHVHQEYAEDWEITRCLDLRDGSEFEITTTASVRRVS